MGSELTILALFGLLIAVIIVLNILTAMGQVGLMTLGGSREDMPALTGMAGRINRTLENSVVAMTLFAPAILVLWAQDAFTSATLLTAQIFLLARVAFVPIYALGLPIPFLRTTVWLIGFCANVWLYILALS